jgi:hypothetical protein
LTLLPVETVQAYVLDEIEGAAAWAKRRGYDLDFNENDLALAMMLEGPSNNSGTESYLLKGTFVDYRAVPPAWWFAHPETGEDIGPPAYPAAPLANRRGSSLFISGGPTGAVICASFNRLAYGAEQGPHGEEDWGPPSNWLGVSQPSYTRAETIGDMLARIEVEVRESPGRMAPLP